MKKYFCILTLFVTGFVAVSCNDNILEEVKSYVVLSPENTYTTGSDVIFEVKGLADYIYFYSGEVGSQYIYKDRTTIAKEDLEKCSLEIHYTAQYGEPGKLDVYASKSFTGLYGNNAEADYATMQAIQASMDVNKNIPGWEKLAYVDTSSGGATTEQYDITDYADSFCLAFHWNTSNFTISQRTYKVNIYLKVKFRGYDEAVMRGADLGMISVSMNYPDDPYYRNKGNGSVIFTNAAFDFIMQGVSGNALDFCLDSWVVTTPRPLNMVTPDKGLSVKAMADNIQEYKYVYEQPGIYTATFVMINGNYQGVNQKVQDVTVTIIDPIEDP